MNSRPSPTPFELVNTLWLAAVGLYFLDHTGLTRSIGFPDFLSIPLDACLGFAGVLLLIIWIWGLILRSLTGERHTPHAPFFRSDFQNFLPLALLYILLPHLAHFVLYMLSGREAASIAQLKVLLHPVFAGFAARLLAGTIYSISLSITGGRLTDLVRMSVVNLGIGISGYALINAAALVPPPFGVLLDRASGLICIQLQLLAFAYSARDLFRQNPQLLEKFSNIKTLVLVNPLCGSLRVEALSEYILRRYPAVFQVLRALTPPDYRVVEYNRVSWKNHYFHHNALVAITCISSNASSAYRLAREFRRRGCTVILGGPHVSFFPQEALAYADAVVAGPAESVWSQLVTDYEQKQLKKIYHGECEQKNSTGYINTCLTSLLS